MLLVRGEMAGGERESRDEAWKGEGRLRNSESESESIRRDWTLEEWKGILGVGCFR